MPHHLVDDIFPLYIHRITMVGLFHDRSPKSQVQAMTRTSIVSSWWTDQRHRKEVLGPLEQDLGISHFLRFFFPWNKPSSYGGLPHHFFKETYIYIYIYICTHEEPCVHMIYIYIYTYLTLLLLIVGVFLLLLMGSLTWLSRHHGSLTSTLFGGGKPNSRGKISTCPLAPVVHSSLWAQSLSGTPKVYSRHRDSQQ